MLDICSECSHGYAGSGERQFFCLQDEHFSGCKWQKAAAANGYIILEITLVPDSLERKRSL